MASARFAWGIDIGNRALKAVKLVREGDQLRVDDFELIEHETVLSNSGDNRENFIQTALASFVQRHTVKGGAIAVGVSGQQSFARFIKLPPVESKKIPEIVRFEAIQQIPFPLDDVEWSYQLFQQPDSPDVEVGIFAMRKELVNQHIKYFTDFDLNVQVVQMNPLAVYNAMYFDQRLQHGTTMVVDLGAENTDLIIADRETIWMRSIPIGGNNFTQTLEKAFKLPFSKAEELKRNSATSKYARQIFQAMRPVFADLVAEIQRSIGFYASVHRDSRIRKIMALGGTFKLPGLQKYLQQNLQLDVERPDHVASGVPADPKLASTFQENLLSVISAYGLAVQAMGESKITSSLLPQRIRREKMWKEKTKWFAATAALFVLGSAIPLGSYILQDQLFARQQDDRSRAEDIQRKAADLDRQWSEIESSGGTDRAMIANVNAMVAHRDTMRGLLVDVDNALPKPQPPVLEGLRQVGTETDAAVRKIRQVERPKREMVVVNDINMKYLPDVTSTLSSDLKTVAGGATGTTGTYVPPNQQSGGMEDLTDPNEGASAQQQPTDQPPADSETPTGAPQRGFLVTMLCTTPNAMALEQDGLIEAKLIPTLNNIKPNDKLPQKPYAVKKATLLWIKQIKDDEARLQRMKQEYDFEKRAKDLAQRGVAPPPGGAAPPPPPRGADGELPPLDPRQPGGEPGAAAKEPPHPAFMDRLLGEDIREDFEFAVAFVVVLDPPHFTPEAPAPSAAAN